MNTDNNQQNIPMTEEQLRSHKKIFSRISFSILAFLLVAELAIFAAVYILKSLAPELLSSYNFSLILSAAVQYGVALPVMILIIRKLPRRAPEKKRLGAKGLLGYLLAGVFIMYIGNYISQILMTNVESLLGSQVENSISALLSDTDLIFSLIFVGIIGPIVEELMFRKLIIDRLTEYSTAVAVLFPALLFGLFHGNLYQLFYAFAVGVVFSYIYVKTGKIIYSVILHVSVNLLCGVIPSFLMSLVDMGQITSPAYISEKFVPFLLIALYDLIYYAMIIAGAVILIRNARKISFSKGRVSLPRGKSAEVVLFNAGTIAVISASILIIAVNTFA